MRTATNHHPKTAGAPTHATGLQRRRPEGSPASTGGQFDTVQRPDAGQLHTGQQRAEDLDRLLNHVALRPVIDRFADGDIDLYVVGGPVRDLLDRGDEGDDLDLCTPADVATVRALVDDLGALDPSGEDYGTVKLHRTVSDGETWKIEITQFRGETYLDGSRKPVTAPADDLDADLARRDFTVNAMAVNTRTGELLDPHGGADDLRSGLLRAVGDPHARFQEDPLRVLRAVRFAATRDLTIHPDTVTAARAAVGNMGIVSTERRRDELQKVLAAGGDALGNAVSKARWLNAEPALFGGIDTSVVDRCDPRLLSTTGARLGLLASGTDGPTALRAMKFPNAVVDRARRVAETTRMVDTATSQTAARAAVRNLDDSELADVEMLLMARNRRPAADKLRRARSSAAQWRRPRPVKGDDAIAAGLSGPAIGAALRAVDDAMVNDATFDRAAALELLAAHANPSRSVASST